MFKKVFSMGAALIFVLSLVDFAMPQNKPTALQAKFQEMVASAKSTIKSVPLEVVKNAIDKKENAVILDVREPQEFADGHLPGAKNIPRGILEGTIINQITDENTRIYVYCKTTNRAALATKTLNELGYKNAVMGNFHYEDWVKAGFPVER